MNVLLEKGVISEMECGNNFAYILNDNSIFLSTEYKVLQSQEDGCFIRCMKLLYNGKMQFYYLTDGYKSLANMLPSLDAESFMTIMASVFSNVLAVKQNGFLSCQNIDIDFRKIFVNPNTYKVTFVYLPVSKRLHLDESTFENELRTNFVRVLSGVAALSSPKTIQFMEDLSNGMLSIRELYDRSRGGRSAKAGGKTGTRAWNEVAEGQGNLRIVAMNSPVRVEVEVTKDVFVIGKNVAVVDGVISFNKMISRVHCRITRENGQHMIADLQSANGTYVNGVRLVPNQAYPIKNGDIVRLANSDFQVVIS